MEGFLTLTPVTDGEPALSAPFMDITVICRIFRSLTLIYMMMKRLPMYETELGQFRNSDGGGYILGHNIYIAGADDYDEKKIAIQGGDRSKNVTAVLSLLRNVETLTFSVEDSDGEQVYEETEQTVQKTFLNGEAYYTRWLLKAGHRMITGMKLLRTEIMSIKFPRNMTEMCRRLNFRSSSTVYSRK